MDKGPTCHSKIFQTLKNLKTWDSLVCISVGSMPKEDIRKKLNKDQITNQLTRGNIISPNKANEIM